MTDEQMDARLRAAGERWRTENATVAVVEPTAVVEPAEVVPGRTPRRRWGLVASAAAVAAALVVGGTFLLRGTHDGPTPTGDTAALEGHVWLLTDQHSSNSTATLYIDRDGNLVADDECTLIGGKAAVDGDSLTVTDQIVRYKSCTDQYGPGYYTDGTAVLDGASTFTITPDALTISKNGKDLRFELAPANTPAPTLDFPTLVGANWALISAKDADGNAVPVAGDPALLHIADDGTLSGSDGCNSLQGKVTTDGGEVTFGTIGGTEKGCSGDAAATEKAILAFMQGTAQATAVGGELTLTKGSAELVYRWNPSGDDTDPAQLQGVTWQLVDDAGTAMPADTTVDFSAADWTLENGTLRARAGATGPLAGLFQSSQHAWYVRDDRLYVLLNDAQASALVFANGVNPPPTNVHLVGPTWHLTSIKAGDGRYRNGAPPAEDSTLTVTATGFTVPHVCYTQQGSITTAKDTITVGDTHAVDAHPCPFQPGRDHAAQLVDSILSGTAHWSIDRSTLTIIKAGSGTLEYTTTPLTGQAPLIGTTWKLETAVTDNGKELPATGNTLTIDDSEHLVAADTTNPISADVQIHDGTLSLDDLVVGGVASSPVELVVGAVLHAGEVGYAIAGNALTLTRGAAQLIYRAPAQSRADSVVGSWTVTTIEHGTGPDGTARQSSLQGPLVFDGVATARFGDCLASPAIADASRIKFGDWTTNLGNCPSLRTPDGTFAFGQMLTGTCTWAIDGDQLTITKAGVGALILTRS